jgi:hypothetical protein
MVGMSNVVGRGVLWAMASLATTGLARAQEVEQMGSDPQEGVIATGPLRRGHEALQLTLNGSLIDYLKQTIELDTPPGSSVAPAEQESSTTSFGALGSGLGIGVGYVWDQVLLGARMQLSSVTRSPNGGGEAHALSVGFAPRLEVIFGTESTRPYLAGLLQVDHASLSTTSAVGSTGTSTFEDSSTRFGLGAAFGIHAFLNRSVSIDPEILILPSWGSGSAKSSSGSAQASQDYSLNTLRVMVTLGLSGWIDTGGAPPPPPPREQTTVAAPIAAAPAVIVEPVAAALSADIHLPNHRKLYLQVLKDPARPFALTRLTEPRDRFALAKCDDVSIVASSGPIPLAIRTHGEHYLTGRLPIRGAEVLAGFVDSSISVCGEQWLLGQESREQVQAFLKARRELIDDNSPDELPENQPGEVVPPAPVEVTPAPSAAPSPMPSTPPAGPKK